MIDNIIDDILNILVNKIKDKKYSDKLNAMIIDPMIMHILDKFYPYILTSIIIFSLIFILIICIFYLSLRHNL